MMGWRFYNFKEQDYKIYSIIYEFNIGRLLDDIMLNSPIPTCVPIIWSFKITCIAWMSSLVFMGNLQHITTTSNCWTTKLDPRGLK